MKCPKCSKEIEKDAVYCKECGADIKKDGFKKGSKLVTAANINALIGIPVAFFVVTPLILFGGLSDNRFTIDITIYGLIAYIVLSILAVFYSIYQSVKHDKVKRIAYLVMISIFLVFVAWFIYKIYTIVK